MCIAAYISLWIMVSEGGLLAASKEGYEGVRGRHSQVGGQMC